jgi:hypothetical protein
VRDRENNPQAMIRISITAAAFEAIAATMKLGSVGVEPDPVDQGERQIWLEPRTWIGCALCEGRASPTAT